MAKKSRLHEFEKNNRVINIPQAQDARRERLEIARQKKAGTRKKKIRINYMRMALFALVLVIGISFVVSAVKIVQLQGEKKEVAAKNDELTHKKETLEMEYENVKLPEYIENQARRDLKLVKPQELLFAFNEEKQSGKTGNDSGTDDTKQTEDQNTDGKTKN
mgnify:FL=1